MKEEIHVYLSILLPETALKYVDDEINRRTTAWWQDKNGNQVKVGDMDLDHLLNLRKFLKRHIGTMDKILENMGEEQ